MGCFRGYSKLWCTVIGDLFDNFFPDSRSLCKMQSCVQTQYKIDSPNSNFMGSKRLRHILRPFSICLRIFSIIFSLILDHCAKYSQACKLSIKLTHQILILWARRDLDIYCVLSRFVNEFFQLFFPLIFDHCAKCSQACKLSIKLTHQILILWARRDLDVYCVLSRFV